jgi:hypothetical protein
LSWRRARRIPPGKGNGVGLQLHRGLYLRSLVRVFGPSVFGPSVFDPSVFDRSTRAQSGTYRTSSSTLSRW